MRRAERCDRPPTFGAQFPGRLAVVPKRKEHGVRSHLGGLDRFDQLLGIEREAGRGLIAAADPVSAAAAERAAHAVGVDREAEPALVFEAVALARVERQAGSAGDPFGDLLQPVDPAGESAAGVDLRKLGDRFLEWSCGVEQRQVSRAARIPERAGILGVELTAHGGDLLGIERKLLRGKRIDQVGQREVHRDANGAHCLQRGNRQFDDLGRGSSGVTADQLGAKLQGFPPGVELLSGDARDLSGIA